MYTFHMHGPKHNNILHIQLSCPHGGVPISSGVVPITCVPGYNPVAKPVFFFRVQCECRSVDPCGLPGPHDQCSLGHLT